VLRPRVIDRIRQAASRRIVLVVAPAGFGKSVAIRQYLEADRIEHLTFAVRKEHTTLAGFLRGFIAALEPIAPKASKSVAGAYEKAAKGGNLVGDLASWVSALLGQYAGMVVLDDLHLTMSDPRIARLISDVISLTPESLKWIIATRSSLALPFASWLAYGQMQETITERDLMLSSEEAGLAARDWHPSMQLDQVLHLLEFTGGWPAAFLFALHAFRNRTDSATVIAEARETLYNYLAHQVFRELTSTDQEFLLETSVLDYVDVSLLEANGLPQARDIIGRLRESTAFISAESTDTYRYHDLFRDFLDYELRAKGSIFHNSALDRMASVLENARFFDHALRLYVQSQNTSSIVRLLIAHGYDLFSNGDFETIASALDAIPDELRHRDVDLLLLDARTRAVRGDDGGAVAYYLRAKRHAMSDATRAHVAWRYSAYLLHLQRYAEALEGLEGISDLSIIDLRVRCGLRATKAAILACMSRFDEATELLTSALLDLQEVDDESLAVILYSYASFVRIKTRDIVGARSIATRCIELAARLGMYDFATVACTHLYELALDRDDWEEATWALDQMIIHSKRAGDPRMRSLAVLNMFDRAVIRGDELEIERFQPSLVERQAVDAITWWVSALPTLAMQAACRGDLRGAYEILNDDTYVDQDSRQRALRLSEIALYAASSLPRAIGAPRAADAASAIKALTDDHDRGSARIVRARVMLALAELLLGRFQPANLILRELEAERGSYSATLRLLVQCARAVYVTSRIGVGHDESSVLLGRLRKSEIGGIALLISLLPLNGPDGSGSFFSLTASELEVLTLLAGGRSSRDIGAVLGRSPLTVDTHVKSLLRKLGCSNRKEAAELAREHGLTWS
jgi:ATP/maltotriose-dependent transcriptional regulator MalT